jgi:Tfp pilus assembly protein PilW
MKLCRTRNVGGFSVGEMVVAVGLSSVLFTAAIASFISLQQSMSGVDDFFSTHVQQIRIIDYLSRDVKRSYGVTTSVDKLTVTCTIPDYVIKAGDSDAGAGNANVGKRRAPAITPTSNGTVVNYGNSTSTVVYALNNQSITRTENGVVTTIASSTDSLVPETIDVEQANTEYTNSTVTFMPKFHGHGNGNGQGQLDPSRVGTTVFAKAYLRNKRRN